MVINKYLAELVGTFILVFIGTMSILASGAMGASPIIVVPFGFGLGLLAAIYAVGHVSGGHFNPAVTLGSYLNGDTDLSDLIGYWIGQAAGATLASLAVLSASSQAHVASTYTASSTGASTGSIFTLEVALTAIFVLVFMASSKTAPKVAAWAISFTLAAVYFAGLPFSGSSVNPARSIGPAIVGNTGANLWVYLVAPLVGAVVAWFLYRLFGAEETAEAS